MARPAKEGIDYFPLDVHVCDKIKLIQIKYGLEGFALVIKLFQRIYSEGYFCRWEEDEALLFADENKIDLSLLKEVVSDCLKRRLFEKTIFDQYKVLTSKGIQKRYRDIIKRRKEFVWDERYTLVNNVSTICKHDANNNPQKDEIIPTKCDQHAGSKPVEKELPKEPCQPNGYKSTQSKVKESKEYNKAFSNEKAAELHVPKSVEQNNHFSQKVGVYSNEILSACKKASEIIDIKKFNPYQFSQKFANDYKHPGAILKALQVLNTTIRAGKLRGDPYPYAKSIVDKESGNYREQEFLHEAQVFKTFITNPEIQKLYKPRNLH